MRLTRKSNGIWMLELTKDGRRVRLSTGTRDRKEADRVVPVLMGEAVAGGGWPFRAALWYTYETVWKHCKAARGIFLTCRLVEEELGKETVETVTYARLQEWTRRMLEAGSKPATINRKLAVVSRSLGEAVKLGKLAGVPPMPRLAENNQRDRYVTAQEEARLLEAAARDTSERGRYLWALVVFCLNSGARLSEALGFTFDDYLLIGDDAQVTFRDTKNGRHRTVPLTPAGKLAAEAMLASPLHGRYTVWYAVKAFARLCRAASVEGVTLHILRHTYASRLVQRGVPLKTVSELLGHSSVAVTERYAHLAPSTLRAAIAVLTPGNGRPSPSAAGPCQPDPARAEAAPLARSLAQ